MSKDGRMSKVDLDETDQPESLIMSETTTVHAIADSDFGLIFHRHDLP